MRIFYSALFVAVLSGCGHNVTLMERGGPAAGGGAIPYTMMNSGDITITIDGEPYSGRWVLSKGGSYSFGTAFGSSVGAGGASTGTAYGSGINMSASGNGNILARSEAGKGLRCIFNYSGMSRNGAGVCQDDDGRVYDMQIN